MQGLEVVGRRRAIGWAGVFFVIGILLGVSVSLLWSQGRDRERQQGMEQEQAVLRSWLQHLATAEPDAFGDLAATVASVPVASAAMAAVTPPPPSFAAADRGASPPTQAQAQSSVPSPAPSRTPAAQAAPVAPSAPSAPTARPAQPVPPVAQARPTVHPQPVRPPPAQRPVASIAIAPAIAPNPATQGAAMPAASQMQAHNVAAAPAPAPSASASPAAAPAASGAQTAATSAVVRITPEQANIESLTGQSVHFRSGRVIARGDLFPSGERLVNVIPSEGKIVTDRRVIILSVGN